MSVRDKVHAALTKLGQTNGTKLEGSSSNTDPLLHELFVASEIRSHGEKRYKLAKEAVISTGWFDPEDVEIGSTEQVADGDVYALSLQVKEPATRFDVKKFKTALALAGVEQEVIDKAAEAATTKNVPAKVYIVSTK